MYTIHDVVLNASVIGNITSLNHATNRGLVPAFASGVASPKRQYVGESPHSSTLTTTGLEVLLGLNTDTMISEGLCVTGATSVLAFSERVGCLSGSASHQAISTQNVFAYITSLSAQISQSATADVELKYLSADGITSPVTAVSGASLSAAVLLDEFLLAETYIDGVLVDEVSGVTINTGFELIDQKQGAGIYPTDVFLKTVNPSIEITTMDLAKTIALLNGATCSTGVDIYLAKRKDGAVTELYTATEHIKISSTAGGLKHMVSTQASRDDGSGVIKIDMVLPASGTQVCLTAATGVAITV